MKIDVDALKMIMVQKKTSLRELSQQTGLSEVTLASILNADKPRRFKTIGKLIDGLNVKPEEILICND